MNFSAHLIFHPETVLVLPLVCGQHLECDDCDEPDGCSVQVGWLFWSAAFVFSNPGHE